MGAQARTQQANVQKTDVTSVRSLLFVLLVARISIVMIFMPAVTSGSAYEDSWAAALLSLAWSIPLSLLVVWASTAVPGGLLVAANCRWGKWALLFFMPYILVLALVPAYFSAELGTLFVTVTLTETPVGILVAISLLVGMYAAYKGIDTIGRAGQVVITLLVLLSVVTLLGIGYEADTARLQPVFSRGLLPIVTTSINPATWTVITIGLIPALAGEVTRKKKGLFGAALWANVGSMGLLTILAAAAIMVFSAAEAKTFHSPAYMLAKITRIPQTVERFEVIILTAWTYAITLTCGTYLYAAAQAISEALNLRTHRTCLIPLAAFAAAVALTLFASTTQVKHFLPFVAPPVALAVVVFPVAGALLLRRRTAGEQNG